MAIPGPSDAALADIENTASSIRVKLTTIQYGDPAHRDIAGLRPALAGVRRHNHEVREGCRQVTRRERLLGVLYATPRNPDIDERKKRFAALNELV
jgi:hypothetical protein